MHRSFHSLQISVKMTSSLCTLVLLGLLFCVGLATAKTKEQVRAEELDLKLADVETELKASILSNYTVRDQLERLDKLVRVSA